MKWNRQGRMKDNQRKKYLDTLQKFEGTHSKKVGRRILEEKKQKKRKEERE